MDKGGILKAIALISGGIDSPVATYLMNRKGVETIGVYFYNYPFVDERTKKTVIELARRVGCKKLLVVPNGVNVSRYAKQETARYMCILDRRMMYRLCDMLADKYKADFLITGDNLAQVASQTLQNIYTESISSNKAIVRPLIGMDKNDIIAIGRRIGTYDISIKDSSCGDIIPHKPSTNTRPEIVSEIENGLGVKTILEETIKNIEEVELN